jgi:hypothetical protein
MRATGGRSGSQATILNYYPDFGGRYNLSVNFTDCFLLKYFYSSSNFYPDSKACKKNLKLRTREPHPASRKLKVTKESHCARKHIYLNPTENQAMFEKITVPILRKSNDKTESKSSYSITCEIIGAPDSPPVLFCGGVVYDRLLTDLAREYNIKLIVPKLPYWSGGKISDIGYTSLADITIDTMLADLQAVINYCVQEKYIPSEEEEYYYAAAGGSYPGWLTMLLHQRDPHCIGLNLFATPAITLTPEELKEATDKHLKENDIQLDKTTLLKDLGREKKDSPLGLREQLKKDAKPTSEELSSLPPQKQTIEAYRRSINALIWQTPNLEDRIIWQDAAIEESFLNHFFGAIFQAKAELSLAKCMKNTEALIIAGIHDFTLPYDTWLNSLKGLELALVQDKEIGMLFRSKDGVSQIRLVISNGGHLPHVVEAKTERPHASFFPPNKESKQAWPAYLNTKSGFVVDMVVANAYKAWSNCLKERIKEKMYDNASSIEASTVTLSGMK